MLALYGSTVHRRSIMWFSGQFFLLSVHASLKKNKLKVSRCGILIHTLELKLQPFEVSPCLYREAIFLQCFLPTRYVKNGEYPWRALFRKYLKIGV